MGLTDPKEGTVIESAAETVERSQQLIRNSNLQQAIMEEKKQIREERSKRHQEWMQEVQRLRGLKEEYLTKTRQLTELRSKTQSNLASSQDESCSFELAWGLSEDDLFFFRTGTGIVEGADSTAGAGSQREPSQKTNSER